MKVKLENGSYFASRSSTFNTLCYGIVTCKHSEPFKTYLVSFIACVHKLLFCIPCVKTTALFYGHNQFLWFLSLVIILLMFTRLSIPLKTC